MRNLKKILAMALALVMSLSLMATAGATETTAATGTSQYQTATDVLKGVKVIWGDEGGDRLQDTITRAEVAALLYRISTGDVTDSQKDLYTNNAFTDVNGIEWARGYISYCYNAEIIKGNPDGTFEPDENITGYATLAMILRAMGYGKNGEFVGDGWEIQTAATGERIGVLKNINQAQLGQPATREMVAEILFRAILKETVEFSALNPYAYPTTGKTLAKEKLGLEEVEGVVTANEFADLYDTAPLPEGKTKLGAYTIEATTGFDDIGESRLAYIQNGTKVIAIDDSGKNATEETTDAKKVTALLSDAGIKADGETERFVNFGQGTNWTSDYKIRYEITVWTNYTNTKTSLNAFTDDEKAELNAALAAVLSDSRHDGFILPTTYDGKVDGLGYNNSWYSETASGSGRYEWGFTYSAEFRIGAKIGTIHQQNIEEIFNIADKFNESGYITGEVYVGTTSMKDISDEKSFEQFKADYIDETDEAVVSENERGNWLKVIDNDADGSADYVLKVIYTMAQVSRVKDGKITLDVKDRILTDGDTACGKDAVNNLTSQTVTTKDDADYGEPAEDDVVYYAIIDGSAFAYLADMETATFDSVNRNTRVATTTDGTEWTESQICEHIVDEAYMSNITAISRNVSYDVYFDRGGYIAAFAKTEANDFVLVTDGWFNSTKNDGYEYAVKVYDDEAEEQKVVDITAGGSLFISGLVQNNGSRVQNNDWKALKYLGGVIEATGANTDSPVGKLNGADITRDNTVKTTVAAVSGDTILPVESASASGRYERSMIDMKTNDKAGIPDSTYKQGNVYYTTANSDTAYNAELRDDTTNAVVDVEIRALSNTVYYAVYPMANSVGVLTWTGYGKVPSTITDAMIEDVYAVGTKRVADNSLGNADYYYTADIVVIELNTYNYNREIVFLLDDEVSGNGVYDRPVRVIGEDGQEKTVNVTNNPGTNGRVLSDSTRDEGYATPKWYPGLYWLTETATKDLYTIKRLTKDEIRDNGFVAGMIQYEEAPSDYDYVTVKPAVKDDLTGEYVPDNDNKGTPYKVSKDTLWNLAYGVSDYWKYRSYAPSVAETDTASEVLAARRDYTDNAALGQDRDRYQAQTDHNAVKGWYNYNRVLISTKGGSMVYAISFANLLSDGKTYDFAREVWEECVPSAAAAAGGPKITFFGEEFSTAVNGKITGSVTYTQAVKADGTVDISVNNGTLVIFQNVNVDDNTSYDLEPNKSERVYTGTILSKDGKTYYTFELTQKAESGEHGVLSTKDLDKLIVTGGKTDADGVDQYTFNINPAETQTTVRSLVEKLVARSGHAILDVTAPHTDGFEAYDQYNNPVDPDQSCLTVETIRFYLKNAKGETYEAVATCTTSNTGWTAAVGGLSTVTVQTKIATAGAASDDTNGVVGVYLNWEYPNSPNNIKVKPTSNNYTYKVPAGADLMFVVESEKWNVVDETTDNWSVTDGGGDPGTINNEVSGTWKDGTYWNAAYCPAKWGTFTVLFTIAEPAPTTPPVVSLAQQVKDKLNSDGFVVHASGTVDNDADDNALAAIKSMIEAELGAEAAALITGVGTTKTTLVGTAVNTTVINNNFTVKVQNGATEDDNVAVKSVRWTLLYDKAGAETAIKTAISSLGATAVSSADGTTDAEKLQSLIKKTIEDVANVTGVTVSLPQEQKNGAGGTVDSVDQNDEWVVNWTAKYNGNVDISGSDVKVTIS